jgi:hypothetical protein
MNHTVSKFGMSYGYLNAFVRVSHTNFLCYKPLPTFLEGTIFVIKIQVDIFKALIVKSE